MYCSKTRLKIAWIAGILEGEGSFIVKAHGGGIVVCCTMTDLDVLERIQEFAGGTIYERKKQKEHHKQSWVWRVNGKKAYYITKQVLPYLLARRREKARKMMRVHENSHYIKSKDNQIEIKRLRREEHLSHKAIAEKFGFHRSYVSHVLRGRYD
jgi:hypothetical protein